MRPAKLKVMMGNKVQPVEISVLPQSIVLVKYSNITHVHIIGLPAVTIILDMPCKEAEEEIQAALDHPPTAPIIRLKEKE